MKPCFKVVLETEEEISRCFNALLKEIETERYSPLGEYTFKDVIMIKSYILLSHASLEIMIESIVFQYVENVLDSLPKDFKMPLRMLNLMSHFEATPELSSSLHLLRSGSDAGKIRKALIGEGSSLRRTLSDNHGIKEDNLRKTIGLLGRELVTHKSEPEGEQLCHIGELLGNQRGAWAHGNLHGITKLDDYRLIVKRVERFISILKQIATSLDSEY